MTENLKPLTQEDLTRIMQTLVRSIRYEIQQDPDLSACESFADLHDFCDANELGDSESFADGFDMPFQTKIDILFEAQDTISEELPYTTKCRECGQENCGDSSHE